MLKVRYQKQFKKDLRKMLKQPKYTEEQFVRVLTYLVEEKPLPEEYRDHIFGDMLLACPLSLK